MGGDRSPEDVQRVADTLDARGAEIAHCEVTANELCDVLSEVDASSLRELLHARR